MVSKNDTVVIDLEGKSLLPGFIDAHGHFSGVGQVNDYANLASPPVGIVTDHESLKQQLINFIESKSIYIKRNLLITQVYCLLCFFHGILF